jgi:hypothetical protein
MGFIMSHRQALPFPSIIKRAYLGAELACHMQLGCLEQPLFNYLIVTSGKRYNSFFVLKMLYHYPEMKRVMWVGEKDLAISDGTLTGADSEEFFAVHWAGQWRPTAFDNRIHKFSRLFSRNIKPPTVRRFLRNGALWNFYSSS